MNTLLNLASAYPMGFGAVMAVLFALVILFFVWTVAPRVLGSADVSGPVQVSDLTTWTTTQNDTLGRLRFEGGKWYKYVKLINDTASVTVAGVAGDPCAYSVGGPALNQVTLDNTSGDAQPIVAGFLTGTVTGTYNVSYYGWIQTTGLVVVPTAVTSGVIGSGCMMAAGDKTLTIATGVIESQAILITATASNNKILAHCPM